MLFTSTINDIRALIWPRSLLQPLYLCLDNINPKTTPDPSNITSKNCCYSCYKQVIPCQHLVLICKLLWNSLNSPPDIHGRSLLVFTDNDEPSGTEKHSHRFHMFIYEVTQYIPSTGKSALQAQHSCGCIRYFVIPTALRRNRICKGIIFVYNMLPFPV